MKRRDEMSRVDSCLNKAGDDEPVFVLRANDELAAEVVRYWASKYMAQKMGENFETRGSAALTAPQLNKAMEARQLASDMDEWRARQAAAKKS